MGANAQTTVPTFTAGQVLTAAQMNDSARTGVPVFADATARDAAFGGTGEKTLAEGQLCYLEDSNIVQYYDGSNWQTLAPADTPGLVFLTAGTFTTASTVTVDNVFSATYESYQIVCRYNTSTTNNVLARLRVGGSSASTNYNFQGISGVSTSATAARTTSTTQWTVADQTNGNFKSMFICVLNGPALAEPTVAWTENPSNVGAYTDVRANLYGMNHTTATAYDGIEIYVATGTFTGTYQIYGLRK